MNLLWLLVVILVIAALLGAPNFGPLQHGYGYGPSGGLGAVVIILVVLLLLGKI
jgi:hypothetical protein